MVGIVKCYPVWRAATVVLAALCFGSSLLRFDAVGVGLALAALLMASVLARPAGSCSAPALAESGQRQTQAETAPLRNSAARAQEHCAELQAVARRARALAAVAAANTRHATPRARKTARQVLDASRTHLRAAHPSMLRRILNQARPVAPSWRQ